MIRYWAKVHAPYSVIRAEDIGSGPTERPFGRDASSRV
jgi:hypothetical protein